MKKDTIDELHALNRSNPVEAVFVLKSPTGVDVDASATESAIKSLIERAESATKQRAVAHVVMPRIRSFSLRAAPDIIEHIARDEAIFSARLNTDGDMLIRPVDQKEYKMPETK